MLYIIIPLHFIYKTLTHLDTLLESKTLSLLSHRYSFSHHSMVQCKIVSDTLFHLHRIQSNLTTWTIPPIRHPLSHWILHAAYDWMLEVADILAHVYRLTHHGEMNNEEHASLCLDNAIARFWLIEDGVWEVAGKTKARNGAWIFILPEHVTLLQISTW
jgi:hypothetical protein